MARTRLPLLPTERTTLPRFAAQWAAAVLGDAPPAERHATCDDCAMAPPSGERWAPDSAWFDPALKCCTFVPTLANFQVGAVFDEPESVGAARLRERITRRAGVTVLGVGDTAREAMLLRELPTTFGRARALRCPYLSDAGGCTVWNARNAVCATWFCKHERGVVAERFWHALKRYLSTAERAVAIRCALSLDVSADALQGCLPRAGEHPAGLSPSDLDGEVEPARYAASWGRWKGREEAYFRECARVASSLDASGLAAAGGAALEAEARILRAAWDALHDPSLPARLALGNVRIVSANAETATMIGYREYDPVQVPRALADLLPDLSGRTPDAARRWLVREHGLRVDESLLRRLVDFGLLADSNPKGDPTT